MQFFANHPDIYKPLLKVNRSLEGLKRSVLRHFKSWGDAVVQANIVNEEFYDEQGKPNGSTEELRISKFLTMHNIPYRKCTKDDNIIVQDEELIKKGYKSFVPDFIIVMNMVMMLLLLKFLVV